MNQSDQEFELQQHYVINAAYEDMKARARAEGKPHTVTREKVSVIHGKDTGWLKRFRTNHFTPSRQARIKCK